MGPENERLLTSPCVLWARHAPVSVHGPRGTCGSWYSWASAATGTQWWVNMLGTAEQEDGCCLGRNGRTLPPRLAGREAGSARDGALASGKLDLSRKRGPGITRTSRALIRRRMHTERTHADLLSVHYSKFSSMSIHFIVSVDTGPARNIHPGPAHRLGSPAWVLGFPARGGHQAGGQQS